LRGKLDALYGHEPSAKEEAREVKQLVKDHDHLSKHQKYMKQLAESGMNTAQVQTAWHEYYQNLTDDEKLEVWQEFYDEQAVHNKKRAERELAERIAHEADRPQTPQTHRARSYHYEQTNPKRKHNLHSTTLPKSKLAHAKHRVKKLKENHHVRSLVFGFSMGFFVIFILLFSFFNERFVVPFIRPNQNVSATPIIVDPNSTEPVGPEAKIIIPKINLEAPVVYDVPTIEEKAVQKGLERGVVHYATTPNPGEKGNSVIFGHSSGNILNKGKYKFAFLLLKSVEVGDTFIVQKDSKRYVYKIYNKYVTIPEDVSVLLPGDKPAMMTLITCDPPGTSTNRLIIQAEQIFPDPNSNAVNAVAETSVSQPKVLPSNSESLWHRIFN
jgi:sortase A